MTDVPSVVSPAEPEGSGPTPSAGASAAGRAAAPTRRAAGRGVATGPEREALAGLVERVTFHNPDNGFCVLRVKVRGQRDLVTVVGAAAMISAGEFVQASGNWINDRVHSPGEWTACSEESVVSAYPEGTLTSQRVSVALPAAERKTNACRGSRSRRRLG
jgi:hypothetical protein